MLADGYILIRYSVGSNGRAEDVKVVESDPPDLMDKALVSTFLRSYFRARRVDGAAVNTDRLLYQLDFQYVEETKKKRSEDSLDYPEAAIESDEDSDRGGKLSYPKKGPE